MNELRAWLVIGSRLARYLLSRLGWGEQPTLLDRLPEAMAVLSRTMKWRKRLRIIGSEHCPTEGPAIFVGNHFHGQDPFFMFRAIYLASGCRVLPRIMMRDGLFDGTWLKSKLLDGNELTSMLGAIHINRDHVTFSQIKPFLNVLREGNCFLMYPGRTRSRSGTLIEYRDGIEEPGSVSLFVGHAQRSRPELKVAAVPMARTFNPATQRTMIIFGEPLYLPTGADRAQQRTFDLRIIQLIGDQVEVNASHILAAFIYLRCLHGFPARAGVPLLEAAVALITGEIRGRHLDQNLKHDIPGEVRRTLRFLASRRIVRIRRQAVEWDAPAILAVPPPDAHYRTRNPVKHIVNQILHLPDVIEAIEKAALT